MSKPILPPLLTAVRAETPFNTAIENVRTRKAGAGDLFWADDRDRALLAVVLEPDVPMLRALEMVPLSMVALGDSLGVLVPPQVGVQFRAPLQVVVNAGIVGSIEVAMAKAASDEDIPDWLVIGVEIGLSRGEDQPEPGLQPDLTTLDEEGCETLGRNKFIETFARHFLTWLADWEEDGFSPVARSWKFKAEDEKEPDMQKMRQAVLWHESAGSE